MGIRLRPGQHRQDPRQVSEVRGKPTHPSLRGSFKRENSPGLSLALASPFSPRGLSFSTWELG